MPILPELEILLMAIEDNEIVSRLNNLYYRH